LAIASNLAGAAKARTRRWPGTIDNLASHGIDTTHVRRVPGVSSGVAPIFVEPDGGNRIFVVKGANDALTTADIDAAAPMLADADCLILQFEIPLAVVLHTTRFARQRGIRCIVNPAPAQRIDLSTFAGVDYVIPNETEAEAITGLPLQSIDDARACAVHLRAQGLAGVIITLGARGAMLAGPDLAGPDLAGIGPQLLPGYAVSATDTSGAGDAFVGSFATFLCEGLAARDAVARANLYAALSTMRPGTQKSFVKREQFESEWLSRL
jgi:ribokinase